MPRLSKDALLGASDLAKKEVELDTIGGSVVVQGLGAKFSNEAQSEALEMKTIGDTQIAKVNTAKLEAIQVLNGLADPKLDSIEEAERFMERCGPAVRAVVDAIDELSGLDKKAIEEAKARFPVGEEAAQAGDEAEGDGPSAGGSRPAVPSGAGA
jgi:hypothetical protein